MPIYFNEHGQQVRKDGTLVVKRPPRTGPRTTAVRKGAVSHFRVDQLLGAEGPLRDEYERLLRDPNTMLKDCAAFFAGRGMPVTQSAIHRHRQAFLADFRQVRHAAQSAAAFCEIVRKQGGEAGGAAFVEAAQGHFEMKLMQTMSELDDPGKLTPEQWERYGKTLKGSAATRRDLEQMREEYRRRVAEAAKAAEEGMKKGATTKDVVARMREIMGV